MANQPASADHSRYSNLEIQVGNVATQLGDFIKESRADRERDERERSKIWSAIKEQGDQMRIAFDKLSSKGQISWPMIMTAIGTLLLVGSAVATVGQMLMESRIKQLEIVDRWTREVMEEKIKQLEIRAEYLRDLGRENHDSLRDLKR